jgi:flagellar basal body-associated protein FliL
MTTSNEKRADEIPDEVIIVAEVEHVLKQSDMDVESSGDMVKATEMSNSNEPVNSEKSEDVPISDKTIENGQKKRSLFFFVMLVLVAVIAVILITILALVLQNDDSSDDSIAMQANVTAVNPGDDKDNAEEARVTRLPRHLRGHAVAIRLEMVSAKIPENVALQLVFVEQRIYSVEGL